MLYHIVRQFNFYLPHCQKLYPPTIWFPLFRVFHTMDFLSLSLPIYLFSISLLTSLLFMKWLEIRAENSIRFSFHNAPKTPFRFFGRKILFALKNTWKKIIVSYFGLYLSSTWLNIYFLSAIHTHHFGMPEESLKCSMCEFLLV